MDASFSGARTLVITLNQKFVKWLFYKENAVQILYDNGGVWIASSRVWQAISPCQSETLCLEACDAITDVYGDRTCIWQPYLQIHLHPFLLNNNYLPLGYFFKGLENWIIERMSSKSILLQCRCIDFVYEEKMDIHY